MTDLAQMLRGVARSGLWFRLDYHPGSHKWTAKIEQDGQAIYGDGTTAQKAVADALAQQRKQ